MQTPLLGLSFPVLALLPQTIDHDDPFFFFLNIFILNYAFVREFCCDGDQKGFNGRDQDI